MSMLRLDSNLRFGFGDQNSDSQRKEEFLERAKSYLKLDDASMEVLADELSSSYSTSVSTSHTSAMSFMSKLLNKSHAVILRVCVRRDECKLALLNMEKDDGSQGLENERAVLLENLTEWRQALLDFEQQLQRQAETQTYGLVKDLEKTLSPARRILDLLDSSDGQTRNLASLTQDTALVGKLQTRVKKLSTDLAAARHLSQDMQKEMKAELSLVHDVNIEQQKSIENERIILHNKYYEDVKNRVEVRVQEEKARLAVRLHDAEAKARQHDLAVSRTLDLEKRVEDLLHENAKHNSAKLDLSLRYKELRREKEATQQGYEQMRRENEQAECKIATLEAELSNLRADTCRDSTKSQNVDDLTDGGEESSDQTTRDQTPVTQGVKIMTHIEQLTESDRLEMIKQRWRNELSHAENEEQKCETALKDTETQIALALRQLEEIQPLKASQAGTSGTRAARTTTEQPHSDGTKSSVSASEHTASPPAVRIVGNTVGNAVVGRTRQHPPTTSRRSSQPMSFNLDVLFACEPDAAVEVGPVLAAKLCSGTDVSKVDTPLYDEEPGGVSLMADELIGGPVADTGLPFGMHVDTYAEDTIISLLREQHTKSSSDITLQNEIAGQKNRLKGAGKKVRNAKDVAGKQEEKAKVATHNQQMHTSSERKMKQERKEAVAEVQSLMKLCKDLQADLEVEQSGRPHLRKGVSTSDTTPAIIPIELTIYCGDFLQLSRIFEANQITITEEMEHCYEGWTDRQVLGAYSASNQEGGW
ncbi:Trafficking protein particle complex subunit 31 [Ascochyta clinopodiicola]|nr:Trafficking protein particle complex subunit 31 [Ascochyta clinopodiicola]